MSSEAFDPVEFINKTYTEATYYELSDSLSALTKSITETQKARKVLIAEHFSKFIECRAIMDEIWEDVQRRCLSRPLTERIEEEHTALTVRYNEILAAVAGDLSESPKEARKLHYMEKYALIFTLKEDLSQNIHLFENFVAIYERAKKLSLKVEKSKFIQKCFEDVQPIIREFLERLYQVIASPDISFDDAHYHFELYFAIQGGKMERKIMNTLLVNFKEHVCAKIGESPRSIVHALSSIKKLLIYVDEDIASSALADLFSKMQKIMLFYDVPSVFSVLSKLKDFGKKLGSEDTQTTAEVKREFFSNLSDLKLKLTKNLVEKEGIEDAVGVFSTLESLLDDNEKNEIRKFITGKLIAEIKRQNLRTFSYLIYEDKKISKIKKVLGPNYSSWNRELKGVQKELREKAISQIARTLGSTIKQGNRAKALMEALKIVTKAPTFFGQILFEAKNAIQSDPVIFYYLAHTMKMEQPVLSASDKKEADSLSVQFKCLITR